MNNRCGQWRDRTSSGTRWRGDLAAWLVLCSLTAACERSDPALSDAARSDTPSVDAEVDAGRLGILTARPPTMSCDFRGQPPSVIQDVTLMPTAWRGVSDVIAADGGLVLTRGGLVYELGPQGPTLVLDLSSRTDAALSLALSTELYVAYQQGDAVQISRFSPGANGFDLMSEDIGLSANPSQAAAIGFAAGSLYVAFGDNSQDPESSMHAANPATLPGSLVRVDVSDWRYETWATGVRRPVGMTFDSSGQLWLADQGIEVGELHRVEENDDLGWPTFDGTTCNGFACEFELERFPQVRIETDDECPLVLGTVSESPNLSEMLFFGSRCTGDIFAIKLNSPDGWLRRERIATATPPLAALTRARLGADSTDLSIGANVETIEPLDPDLPFPTQLSESRCFDENMRPNPGVAPFDVAAPLWTDGSIKHRYFELPPGETIQTNGNGTWSFPIGSVVIKRFLFPIDGVVRDVETRVMVLRNFGWEVHTYRWEGDDARLLDGQATQMLVVDEQEIEHLFPSRSNCVVCHGNGEVELLGLRAAQLDHPVQYDDGERPQLEALREFNYLSGNAAITPVVNFNDESAPIADRARAYLDSNCSHCHRPGGWVSPGIEMDLRYETPFDETELCDVPAQTGSLALRLSPGFPAASRIYQRMNRRDFDQMPPFATSIVDALGVQVVGQWIESLTDCDGP